MNDEQTKALLNLQKLREAGVLTEEEFLANSCKLEHHDKDWEGVLQSCAGLLKFEPNNAAGHFRLGEGYLRLSKFDEAVQHLEKATELDPKQEGLDELLTAAKEERVP